MKMEPKMQDKAMELLFQLKELIRDEGGDPKEWIMENLGGGKVDEPESEEESGSEDMADEQAEEGSDKSGKMAMAIAAMKRKMA